MAASWGAGRAEQKVCWRAGSMDETTADLKAWHLVGRSARMRAVQWAVWRALPRAGRKAARTAAPRADLWDGHSAENLVWTKAAMSGAQRAA